MVISADMARRRRRRLREVSPNCVYICLDEDGRPVYIGCTGDLKSRLSAHRSKPWWHQVDRVDEEWFPNRIGAWRREQELIHMHEPPANVVGTARGRQIVLDGWARRRAAGR